MSQLAFDFGAGLVDAPTPPDAPAEDVIDLAEKTARLAADARAALMEIGWTRSSQSSLSLGKDFPRGRSSGGWHNATHVWVAVTRIRPESAAEIEVGWDKTWAWLRVGMTPEEIALAIDAAARKAALAIGKT